MSKRSITSIVFILIAIIVAAYQHVIVTSAEVVEETDVARVEDVDTPEQFNDSTIQQFVVEPFADLDDIEETVETNALVTHVADGDTFDVTLDDGSDARIRMLGVNTPETVDPRKPVECFGQEASSFVKGLLSDTRVRLEADPQADERDKYGRLLRNVYLADGRDFNALLVSEGYAYAYLSFPLDAERKHELKELENQAREEGRGLWAVDACEDR